MLTDKKRMDFFKSINVTEYSTKQDLKWTPDKPFFFRNIGSFSIWQTGIKNIGIEVRWPLCSITSSFNNT